MDKGRAFQCLKGAYKKDWIRYFGKVCSDRQRDNGFKLKDGRFKLDIKKKSLAMNKVRPWHRLPGETVDAPSLEVFKANLDGVWSNLG